MKSQFYIALMITASLEAFALPACKCTTNFTHVVVWPAGPSGGAFAPVQGNPNQRPILDIWIGHTNCVCECWMNMANPPAPPGGGSTASGTNGFLFPPGLTIPAGNMVNISSAGFVDYQVLTSFGIETSTNGWDWHRSLSVTNWSGTGTSALVAYQGGVPILTNKVTSMALSFQNEVGLRVEATEPRKYFRMVSP